MLDILPSTVLGDIHEHYVTGVARAEYGFEYGQGDEDSLTGALGQAILTKPTIISDEESGDAYIWSTSYHKLRGRGKNAPEKLTGADGIFQIEVRDVKGDIIRRKGLLFQAKKEWSGVDYKLREQVEILNNYEHDAIVIDYSSSGYKACLASEAFKSGADRKSIPPESFKPLSKTLADDFLLCHIGLTGLFYDPKTERLHEPSLSYFTSKSFHIIQTKVRKLL